ncbi:MAG: hypothetical protein K2R98_22140 [Gemmataceae bacterium]|nr:hypothetical protein [Gemmataceae bacterium]
MKELPIKRMLVILTMLVSWNEGWRNDLWAYHVQDNRWEKLSPKLVDTKEGPRFLDNMPSAYDERHNAIVFTDNNRAWAYRFKQ